MNIWLVSFFENTPFDDNQNTRFNSLAREAINQGHNIVFWSTTFRHNTKKQRFDNTTSKFYSESLKVIYLKAKEYNKNISLKRLWSHYQLSGELIRAFENEKPKPDVIFIAYPPISTASATAKWALKNRIPFIVDIIDPWPDVFLKHSGTLKPFFNILMSPLRAKAKTAFSNASAITAISKQYINWSKKYNKKAEKRFFYPAIDLKTVQTQLKDANKIDSGSFTIIYAGSLGYSYDIPTILKAAEIIEKKFKNKIRFVIAGDGPQKDLVEEFQSLHKNLEYLGRIPKEELITQYKNAHLGLTQHIKGATQSVTYKLFDLLSCGLPVLNSLESEMKEIIIENKVGKHNDPGNAEQLSQNIEFYYLNENELSLSSERAIRFTEKTGDSSKVYQELVHFITEKTVSNSI